MMSKQQLILIGGGGHCKACIDVIECEDRYDIIGILDRPELLGQTVLDYKIIGSDNNIADYVKSGYHFLITVGQIKSAAVRKKIFDVLDHYGATFATIVSPAAYVSKHALIGKGTIIMHGVIVNAAAKIGSNCILNTNCGIEHDTTIGNCTHVSTSAVINGDCIVGDEVFIGSNATLSNQITIVNNVVVGSGAVVNKNIETAGIYAGNPIKELK